MSHPPSPRRSPTALPALLGTLWLTLLLGVATAQDATPGATPDAALAALAPVETVLALSFAADTLPFDSLDDELAALPWGEAGETLMKLVAALGGDVNELQGARSELEGAMGELNDLLDALGDECPPLADAARGLEVASLVDEGLLTVSLSPFSPVPAALALARVGDLETAAALQDALVGCFASEQPLQQDDVTLHLLFDGSELPLLVGRLGEVFLVSSDPEVARAVVRRARGSDEASLADTRFWRARDRMADEGLGLALNLAAVADAVETLVPLGAMGPEVEVPSRRLLAALRTLGGAAFQLSASEEGILSESVLAVDAQGGDEALAALLLCDPCGLSRPFVAPAGTVSVRSLRLPLRAWVDYAQSWLDTLAEAGAIPPGEPHDLRDLLRAEVGLDLDAALLDWLGEQLHLLVMEPVSPRLDTLIYEPQQALVVPVASPAAAQAGLEQLGEALAPYRGEIGALLSGTAAIVESMSGGFSPDALGADLGAYGDFDAMAVRPLTYRGVDYTRIQAGLLLDVAVALVGNNLVLASPGDAIEPIVDTFLGGESLLDDRGFREVLAAAPADAAALGWQRLDLQLDGYAELFEVLAQPLAAGFGWLVPVVRFSEGGTAVPEESFGFEEEAFPVQPYEGDFSGAEPLPLAAPGATEAELTADEEDFSVPAAYYRLENLQPGQRVTVELRSDAFDTYLALVDAAASSYLMENDDAPDTSRSALAFTVEAEREYWIEVSSFSGYGSGPYTLNVAIADAGTTPDETEGSDGSDGAEGDANDATGAEQGEEQGEGTTVTELPAPDFAELLTLTELLPDALRVLADHLLALESYTVVDDEAVDGGVLYSRQLLRMDW